jgi:hypothetical protein
MQSGPFRGLLSGHVLVAAMLGGAPSHRRPAEDLVGAMIRSGIAPRLFDLTVNQRDHLSIAVPDAYLEQELPELTIADVVIAAPPRLTGPAAAALRDRFSGTPRVTAFWTGPLDESPAMLQEAASKVDAIWTPTACLAEILLAALPHFAGDIDIVAPRQLSPAHAGEDRAACRARLGLPRSAFVVGSELTIDDALEGQYPAGILAAFHAAFGDDSDAFLALRCEWANGAGDPFPALSRMAEHPRIKLIDTRRHYLPSASLLRACDAWLALPRDTADRAHVDDALGSGLPAIVCARGLPASRWGHPGLFPVRYTRSPNDGGVDWIDPDTAHAAALLRDLRRCALSVA